MLKKKILSLVAGSLLFLANSCSATNLISMGPVSLIVPADTVTNDLITPKFDTDSIQVDKAAHTVDVLIFITPSPYNHYDEYRMERLKLFKDASQSTAHVLRVRYYEHGTDKLIGDYNRGGYSFADANDLSDRYGKYHINSVLQREFAYFLDIPNQDGSPYTTPKDLGLTWIKSTGSVGVFYYPKTVKVKKNKVNLKAAFWYPKQNRIQTVDCTLDYDKKLFKPKSCEMRRINTGEVVETVYRGLIPGLLGPNFINRSFNENDECRILSEFFKDKIVQQ